VIHEQALNVAALKTVEEELNVAIQQASGAFESYLADRSVTKNLAECLLHISQVSGVLKLLELSGALELAQEMAGTVAFMTDNENAQNDFCLSALSHAFIALPCFIEFSLSNQKSVPLLLAPYINELEAAQRKSLSFESRFSDFQFDTQARLKNAEHPSLNLSSGAVEVGAVKRLRHMFQVGLLALLRDEVSGPQLSLLHRALERLQQYTDNAMLLEIWILAAAVVDKLQQQELELTFARKRLISSLDRLIKSAISASEIDQPALELLKGELLFLLALVDDANGALAEMLEVYHLPAVNVSDREIFRLREMMQGPNAKTITSMVNAIKEELTGAKEILEIASQDIGGLTVDLQPLINILTKVSDILKVVGLKSPSDILRAQLVTVQAWFDGDLDMTQAKMLDIADALLFVESSLSSLHRLELNDSVIDQASELSKIEVIANSHLAEAESVVIREAQAGISLAKRAINSFIESNYDAVHISNVAVTLNTVKGGLSVLKLQRAADILAASILFVNTALKKGRQGEETESMLETLADALIALEYYLDEVESHRKADQSVLDVAEESLAALGFPVETAAL
jgi:hypothetical protein